MLPVSGITPTNAAWFTGSNHAWSEMCYAGFTVYNVHYLSTKLSHHSMGLGMAMYVDVEQR